MVPNRGQARDVQSSPSWLRAGAPDGPSGLLWGGSQAARSVTCPEPRDPSRRVGGWAVALLQPQVPACSRVSFPFLCLGFLCLEGSCWPRDSPPWDSTSPGSPPAPAPHLVSGFPSQQRWPSWPAPPHPGIPCPLSALLPHQVASPLQGPPLPNSSSQALLPAATSGWGVQWAESNPSVCPAHIILALKSAAGFRAGGGASPLKGSCLSMRGFPLPPSPKGSRPLAQAAFSQSVWGEPNLTSTPPTYAQVCIYTCMYIHVRVHRHRRRHRHGYTHTHICIHTHVYVRAHTPQQFGADSWALPSLLFTLT